MGVGTNWNCGWALIGNVLGGHVNVRRRQLEFYKHWERYLINCSTFIPQLLSSFLLLFLCRWTPNGIVVGFSSSVHFAPEDLHDFCSRYVPPFQYCTCLRSYSILTGSSTFLHVYYVGTNWNCGWASIRIVGLAHILTYFHGCTHSLTVHISHIRTFFHFFKMLNSFTCFHISPCPCAVLLNGVVVSSG